MRNVFFEDASSDNSSGVAYKNFILKKKVIAFLATQENATIADLSKELGASAPKITTLLSELMASGIVNDFGKIESSGGRRPNIYGIDANSGFFLGIDVNKSFINIGILNFKKTLVSFTEKIPFVYENTRESFDNLCKLILEFINSSNISKKYIFSAGVNLPGRVNNITGGSYSIFSCIEEPLSQSFEKELGIRTFIENDSRAMAYGEYSSGIIKDEKNVLFINIDHGLGMGIIIDGNLYYGKSGLSGELGHIPFLQNEHICSCGKKGCLETEASGDALVRKFKDNLLKGSSSLITSLPNFNIDSITIDDIVTISKKDDVLAIELLEQIGSNLGLGIAMLMNIFNPETVVIGGVLASTENYLLLPIRSTINKYSASLVNKDTKIVLSELNTKAGIMGSALLARTKILTV